jgi:hypothetical protein
LRRGEESAGEGTRNIERKEKIDRANNKFSRHFPAGIYENARIPLENPRKA